MKELKNIKNILFDCDGVLYADLEGVFGQVSKKMTQYISNKLNVDLKKAKELRKKGQAGKAKELEQRAYKRRDRMERQHRQKNENIIREVVRRILKKNL